MDDENINNIDSRILRKESPYDYERINSREWRKERENKEKLINT